MKRAAAVPAEDEGSASPVANSRPTVSEPSDASSNLRGNRLTIHTSATENRLVRTDPAPPPSPATMSVLALQEYEFERQFNEDEAIRWMQENW